MLENIVLKSEKDINALAERVFKLLKNKPAAHVLALSGDLGTGKTTFAKSLGKILGVKNRILSSTFMIFRVYDLDFKKNGFKKFYHADFYRVKSVDELKSVGFLEVVKNTENLVLIEWADKFKEIIPENSIKLNFKHGKNELEREVAFIRE